VYYNLTQDDPFGPFNASDPDSLNDAFQRLARAHSSLGLNASYSNASLVLRVRLCVVCVVSCVSCVVCQCR